MTRAVVLAVAAGCLALVGVLVWGAWQSDDLSSVDDLPSVAEVVAAQAHRHGVNVPELTDADRVRLSAPPKAASTLSPNDQVLTQLLAVRDAAGVDEAVSILSDVAGQSDTVAAECGQLYAALTDGAPASRTASQICLD